MNDERRPSAPPASTSTHALSRVAPRSERLNDLAAMLEALERRVAVLEAERPEARAAIAEQRCTEEVDKVVSRVQNRRRRDETHTFEIPPKARAFALDKREQAA